MDINNSEYNCCRYHRARPIIIDPGLYHSKKSGVFWAKETRSLPASFMLFMGTYYFLNLFLISSKLQARRSVVHAFNYLFHILLDHYKSISCKNCLHW